MKSEGRVWTDPRLLGWAVLMLLTSPALVLFKLSRYLSRRRGFEINPARWTIPPLTPERSAELQSEPGAHVVFVGGGFGEIMMVDRVATALRQARPDVRITYCLRDPLTIEFLRRERPGQNLAYWPFDALPPVARWLRAQRPDVVVFTERFRFITFVCGVARYGAHVALMNGRCRFRDSFKYKLFAPFYRWQFGAFSAMAMQREDYFRAAPRFARKDCDIRLTGDIKTDLSFPALDAERSASLDAWLAGAADLPLVVAASTENLDEERMTLRAFRLAREKMPCRLVLAPRRPWQLDALLEHLEEEGLAVSRRTAGDPPAEIMLLDTLGELTTAYGRAAAAYVGGAYSEGGGGHNVLEPLLWGVPVAYGRQRGHFEALQLLVEQKQVGIRIADEKQLADFWVRFMSNPDERQRVGEIGKKILDDNRGAISRTVETLLPLLDR